MYFRQVFIQGFQSHLVLMFESFVQLVVPVLTPRLHVIRPEALPISFEGERSSKQKKYCVSVFIYFSLYSIPALLKWQSPCADPGGRPSSAADVSAGQHSSVSQPEGIFKSVFFFWFFLFVLITKTRALSLQIKQINTSLVNEVRVPLA